MRRANALRGAPELVTWRWCFLAALALCSSAWGLVQAATPDASIRSVCTNTCNLARNGVCEEGRAGPGQQLTDSAIVYCDLGTDCDDCGPWNTTAPAAATYWEDTKKAGPIRWLRAREAQVRVKPAGLGEVLPFDLLFAYTDPGKDVDVSYYMESMGMVEPKITKIFYRILKDRCVRPDGGRELVVDVGANFGWFALVAARMGCRVIAYEPVPLFHWFLEYNVHINDFATRIEIRSKIVSHEAGKALTMVVPSDGIWGTAGIGGHNIDKSMEGKKYEIDVPSVRLEDEVQEDVLLMKVDVEGWEWAVLQGAEGLLSKFNVENVVMEYSPGVAERQRDYAALNATVRMLVDLLGRHGYRLGHIGDARVLREAFDQPVKPMREITLDNLKYDAEDVRLRRERQLAKERMGGGAPRCGLAPELLALWGACFSSPESLSPRSLRSELDHNTNVWAVKGRSTPLLALEGVVGILDPNDPPTKYTQTNALDVGMGARHCRQLGPKVQVRHRCRCSDADVCGPEQALVERLAASLGAIPQNYVLGDARQALGLK
ncbi:hypothetical protein HYH03_004396 [Edaphochlamys debaryana]|uniref:Methyltransferase FkbM domain-containing protein n=1 Tax=Edaphochlamys debaryana TaxID=47281 RepID=A0A835Y7D7_9CHLO|nr:hypothetical protein HYH03_004396 [Edaphochlamys debaryana]|eukprot:KAG2497657.1 hypothetical protein HYH03_004396 [Edaphochlamys debaryana]